MRRKTLPKFYDPVEDLVQCQLCMKWFKGLTSHIPRIHKITGDQYKEKFGLWNGDLVAIGPRKQLAEKQKKNITKKRLRAFKKNVVNFPREKKKKPKSMFQVLLKKENPLQKPDAIKKMIKARAKYLKSDRYKKDRKRAAEYRKRGRFQRCEVCHKKYWVKKYMFGISKCHSRKCMANHPYTKEKIKRYWKSQEKILKQHRKEREAWKRSEAGKEWRREYTQQWRIKKQLKEKV